MSAEDAEGRGEHLFVRGGRGGSRRTPFCPRRTRRVAENTFLSAEDAEGREEHLFVRGGRGGSRRTPFCPRRTRRVAENTFLSAEDAGSRRTPFCPRRSRRVAENTFLSAEDAEGRGEHLFVAENTFLSAEDAEGRGEHQRRIGFSLRDCAALRRSGVICTWKSLFRQTSTSPSGSRQQVGSRHCWPDTLPGKGTHGG